ncbi:MAG: hypothetical protein A2W29_11175 [Gemmatimonadetes bacterium RBG_16_66_8]|nr:MAG: hypothetical protein A2W29_11175 [Gemmatimonadetes bacterium RBG_16_66_8]
MPSGKIPFVDKRSSNEPEDVVATAFKGRPEPVIGATDEQNSLPVPEHLHRLWLALGLDDE